MFVQGENGGGAFYVDQTHKARTDRWGFAGAYRAGDLVFMSGIVLMATEGEQVGLEAFAIKSRALFNRCGEVLKAAETSLAEVVDIVSFHAWDSPCFEDGLRGDRYAHFGAFAKVKNEFMHEPHAAWTAVGTSGLIVGDTGLVEMRMVAYAPRSKA